LTARNTRAKRTIAMRTIAMRTYVACPGACPCQQPQRLSLQAPKVSQLGQPGSTKPFALVQLEVKLEVQLEVKLQRVSAEKACPKLPKLRKTRTTASLRGWWACQRDDTATALHVARCALSAEQLF
jgi:hypothetical protein